MDRVIAEAESQTFSYGAFDCALFVADVVNAITGQDYAQPYRGYQTEAEADEILHKAGGLGRIPDQFFERIPPQFAVTGDIVWRQKRKRETLGICVGAACCFPKKDGLVWLHRRVIRRAWRVC